MVTLIKTYFRQTVAAAAVAFAVMAPVVVGAMGMGLDLANAYLVRERLSNAVDAAALAGAGSSSEEEAIRQRVIDFFYQNFPAEELGITFDPQVVVNGDEIYVYGNAYYNTMFLHLLGIDKIDVDADTTVQRNVQGIEVALVMDNTGSMATNNNIATLRTAATNFVNTLYDLAEEDEYIRIGLVPYSTSVNVGPYGLGFDLDGKSYGAAFVNNPQNRSYSPGSNHNWGGCVLANDDPADTEDHEGPWDMYRWCRRVSDDYPICDRYWHRYHRTYYPRRSANNICPRVPIVPLTNDKDLLLEHIDDMQASGHTLGSYGMAWGHRVISPEYPFEEGAEWDSLYWRKAIVMMTDGVNTMHPTYSTYGRTSDHDVGASDLNDKFADVCENLKEQGVLIYTITFTSGVSESTKDFYRNCATSIDNYHYAPTQEKLIEVFESISRNLSNLHIKN